MTISYFSENVNKSFSKQADPAPRKTNFSLTFFSFSQNFKFIKQDYLENGRVLLHNRTGCGHLDVHGHTHPYTEVKWKWSSGGRVDHSRTSSMDHQCWRMGSYGHWFRVATKGQAKTAERLTSSGPLSQTQRAVNGLRV